MNSDLFRPMIDKLLYAGVDRGSAEEFADTLHHRASDAKEVVFSEGDELPDIVYLLSGYMKLFRTNESGDVEIHILAGARDFVGCIDAILYGSPARYTAECITDCQLVVIDHHHQQLVKQDHRTHAWLQDIIIRHLLSLAREKATMLPMKATERYVYFKNRHPIFTENIPAGLVANYIGVRPQSLSRIKNGLK